MLSNDLVDNFWKDNMKQVLSAYQNKQDKVSIPVFFSNTKNLSILTTNLQKYSPKEVFNYIKWIDTLTAKEECRIEDYYTVKTYPHVKGIIIYFNTNKNTKNQSRQKFVVREP